MNKEESMHMDVDAIMGESGTSSSFPFSSSSSIPSSTTSIATTSATSTTDIVKILIVYNSSEQQHANPLFVAITPVAMDTQVSIAGINLPTTSSTSKERPIARKIKIKLKEPPIDIIDITAEEEPSSASAAPTSPSPTSLSPPSISPSSSSSPLATETTQRSRVYASEVEKVSGEFIHCKEPPAYTMIEDSVRKIVVPEVLRNHPNFLEWTPSNPPPATFVDTHSGVINVFRRYRHMVSSSSSSILSPEQLHQMDTFFPCSVLVERLRQVPSPASSSSAQAATAAASIGIRNKN